MKVIELWRAYRLYSWFTKEAKMKGWRTIGFNLLSAVALILAGVTELPGVDEKIIAVVNVIGNLILRFVTTTPVGKSE